MKKNVAFYMMFIMAFSFSILIQCIPPDEGILELTIDPNGEEYALYIINFTGPEPKEPMELPGSVVRKSIPLASGNWTIEIQAIDAEGSVLCTTSEHVTLASSSGTPLVVRILYNAPEFIVKQELNVILSDAGSYNFGRVRVGEESDIISFTIENSNENQLRLTPVNSSYIVTNTGQSTDFEIATQPESVVIPAGGSTTFALKFKPTAFGSNGLRSTKVSIFSNAETSPYEFTVRGNASILASGNATFTVSGTFSLKDEVDKQFPGVFVLSTQSLTIAKLVGSGGRGGNSSGSSTGEYPDLILCSYPGGGGGAGEFKSNIVIFENGYNTGFDSSTDYPVSVGIAGSGNGSSFYGQSCGAGSNSPGQTGGSGFPSGSNGTGGGCWNLCCQSPPGIYPGIGGDNGSGYGRGGDAYNNGLNGCVEISWSAWI